MKQSSIDWLIENLTMVYPRIQEMNLITDKARHLHKEEMIDFAFKYGDLTMREMSDSFDKEYK